MAHILPDIGMSTKKLSTKEIKELGQYWEQRLASEGMPAIIKQQIFCPYTKDFKSEVPDTALQGLSERDAFIVDLYNQGKSYRYIVKQLKLKYPIKETLGYTATRNLIKKLKAGAE
jgi:hypothetical protein